MIYYKSGTIWIEDLLYVNGKTNFRFRFVFRFYLCPDLQKYVCQRLSKRYLIEFPFHKVLSTLYALTDNYYHLNAKKNLYLANVCMDWLILIQMQVKNVKNGFVRLTDFQFPTCCIFSFLFCLLAYIYITC